MSVKDYRRKIIVLDVRLRHCPLGTFPFAMFEAMGCPPQEMWLLSVTSQTGFGSPRTDYAPYFNEEDAQAAAACFTVGSEAPDCHPVGPLQNRKLSEVRQVIDNVMTYFPHAATERMLLATTVLHKSDAMEPADGNKLQLSKKAIDTVGQERVEELQEKFGGAWLHATLFEFCQLTLPDTSPESIAATCLYNMHIANDKFAAGYLLRDLESLVKGVEAQAEGNVKRASNAGKGGGDKSSRLREKRVASLLRAIVDLDDRNPGIILNPEKLWLDWALTDATKKDPGLWRQGRGQVKEYLADIKNGSAGAAARQTFLALKKPQLINKA